MANYLSEDNIEQADIDLFLTKLHYNEHINAYGKQLVGRTSFKEVVLKQRLYRKLKALNSELPEKAILEALENSRKAEPL